MVHVWSEAPPHSRMHPRLEVTMHSAQLLYPAVQYGAADA